MTKKGASISEEPAGRAGAAFETIGEHVFPQAWRNDNLGRAMFEATRRFENDVIAVLEKAGFQMIRPAHLTLFRHLDLEGTRLVDLAARANMTKQGMQDLVDKLERLGVVERHPDPGDRRAKFVALTSLGLEIFETLRHAVLDGDRRMAEITGDQDLRQLVAVLHQYARR